MASVLYLCYDGFMLPLGQSQVFPYLRELAKHHQVTLLSYERSEDLADLERRHALAELVRASGIAWIILRYHKTPSIPSKIYDLCAGFIVSSYLVVAHRITIVHCRGYVLAVLALGLKRIFSTRFLFDMRGFWPEEMVDCGAWKAGSVVYRVAKWWEKRFLMNADTVVSLTNAGVAVMREFPYLRNRAQRFEVIPTCADLDIFRPGATAPKNSLTIGFVGSVGSWYQLDHMVDCFKVLLRSRPAANLLILNREDHPMIRRSLEIAGIPADRVEIRAVDYSEVPEHMRRMDAGIFILKPFFSKKGSAPTKLAEFLACGVPCLSNSGTGDYETIFKQEQVGVILDDLTHEKVSAGVERLMQLASDPGIKERCAKVAHKYFSAANGARAYGDIYESIGMIH